jgi:hypothetical protein
MALAITDAILQRYRVELSKLALVRRYVLKVLASQRAPVKWLLRLVAAYEDAWALRVSALLLEKVVDTSEESLRKVDERLRKATDHNSALEAVVEKQRFIVAEFLENFPSASLQSLQR